MRIQITCEGVVQKFKRFVTINNTVRMALDEKTELEYLLLRNYQENGVCLRGLLLRIPFLALGQIEEDKWPFELNERVIEPTSNL